MSFLMTSDVRIKPFVNKIAVSSLSWKTSIDNYCDTAVITVPALCRLVKNGDQYDRVQTGLQFKNGMPVEISCGYDYNNQLRFKGFIAKVNLTVPCTIECEGYSYLIRKKNVAKSYLNSSIKEILSDLIEGTEIKLSDAIPSVPVVNASFSNWTGKQVLDWIKEHYLLSIYLQFDTLFCVLRETAPANEVKFVLGWNTVKDERLVFTKETDLAEVHISLSYRAQNGHLVTVYSGKTGKAEKHIRVKQMTNELMQAIADSERKKLMNVGQEGGLIAFALPCVQKGMTVLLYDKRYSERKGKYFVDSIDGSLDRNGGRQRIHLGNFLGEVTAEEATRVISALPR